MAHANFIRNERIVDQVFEEGRCEHANGDNIARRTECNMCFGNVYKQVNIIKS